MKSIENRRQKMRLVAHGFLAGKGHCSPAILLSTPNLREKSKHLRGLSKTVAGINTRIE